MVLLAYGLCALIWGTTWYAIRVCTGPDGFGLLDSLALRFVIATLVILPLALRQGPWPRGATLRTVLLAGILNATSFAMAYWAVTDLPGAAAAVLYGTQPLVLAVLTTLTGGERMTRPFLFGSLVALVGVSLLAWDRIGEGASHGWAVALILVAVVVSTMYTMLIKRASDQTPALVTTTIFLATTAVLFVVASIANGPELPRPLPVAPTVALVYLAVMGSVVTYLSYFWLVKHTSLKLVSTLVFLFPLVATAMDIAFERAPLTGFVPYAGLALIMMGLGVALFREFKTN